MTTMLMVEKVKMVKGHIPVATTGRKIETNSNQDKLERQHKKWNMCSQPTFPAVLTTSYAPQLVMAVKIS
jgi:hypothetical protein